MNEVTKVAISSDFLTAFAKLPRQTQGKVTEFVNKFRNNPMSPGINYEKLSKGVDQKYIPFGLMIPIEELLFVNRKQAFICFCGWIIMTKPINGRLVSVAKLIQRPVPFRSLMYKWL